MDDFTAIPLEAQTLPEQVSATWLDAVRSYFSGFLFTAVLTVLGATLVTVALVVGVVGSPIIAAAAAYVIIRSRRAERVRVLAT